MGIILLKCTKRNAGKQPARLEENLTWRRTLREATNACGESLPGRVAISWEKGWSDDKDKDRRRPTKDIYAEKATIT
ncbi:MAG: hypothetical protein H6Q31_1387 [Bacteroidetes bacterium]|nr:hypothetical protein [Bacteroidota bacterium]